ncbi:MAG: NHLP bacteriocin export ABC transporter permease/ATPase subunit [Pseudomonadota bacterium]
MAEERMALEKPAPAGSIAGDGCASSWWEKIEELGQKVTILPNERLSFSSSEVFVVRSGEVDLFVQGEDPAGPQALTFLFSVRQEEIIWGSELKGQDPERPAVRYLGKCREAASLLRVARSVFFDPNTHEDSRRETARMLEGWFRRMSGVLLSKAKMPGGERKALAVQGVATMDKQLVYVLEEDCRVVTGLDGSVTVADDPKLELAMGERFFLCRGGWLRAPNGLLVEVTSVAAFLENAGAPESLDRFHLRVQQWLCQTSAQREHAASDRLARKHQQDESLFSQAFARLAGVVGGKDEQDDDLLPPPGEGAADPMLCCLQRIGRALGVAIKAPAAKSGKQTGVARFRSILDGSGVRFRRVALRDEWWCEDSGPMLAFVKGKGLPVALMRKGSHGYSSFDPMTSTDQAVTSEMAETLEHFGFCFYRTLPARALDVKDLLAFAMTPEVKRGFVLVAILGLGTALLGMLTPFFTGVLFDAVIPESERGQLLQIALAMFFITATVTVFNYVRAVALLGMNVRLEMVMQPAVVDRVINLPVSFFRDYSTGDLADRTNSVSAILRATTSIVVDAVLSLLFSAVNIGLLVYYSVPLALLALGLSLGYSLLVMLGYRQLMKHTREVVARQGKLLGLTLQLLGGIAKLRMAAAEKRAFSLWATDLAGQRRESFKAGKLSNLLDVFSAIYPMLVMLAVFSAVGYSQMVELTTGEFVAFNAAFGVFQASMMRVVTATMSAFSVFPQYERIQPILKTCPESHAEKPAPEALRGGIAVRDLTFGYHSGQPPILKDVSLEARPGQFIAVVGPSGSGKSTLLRCLLGFETPQKGSVCYDGQDLASVNLRDVRRQIGVVLQNGELIPGDIFTNIIGSSNRTLEDAWEAAKQADIARDIAEMPMQMHTVINEGASTLSGGQKQRLLIARALVNRPKILFFDEATSALDNLAQAAVNANIERLKVTRVVIAHRLSTIVKADVIFVLKDGVLVESGSYEELLARDGVFAGIAKRQMV